MGGNRSGYSEDVCGDENQWCWIMWRGAVKSAIRGKRGQAFLKELKDALEDLPEKKLIEGELVEDGLYCAVGCLGAKRGLDMSKLAVDDYDKIAEVLGVNAKLIQEIEYENDMCGNDFSRYNWVLNWVKGNIKNG